MQPASFFDTPKSSDTWRATTRDHVQRHYGYWLRFCAAHGVTASCGRIATRVTEDTVLAYIDYLRSSVSINTTAIYVSRLFYAIRAMVPDVDWSWLAKLVLRLEHLVRGPITDKRTCVRDAQVLIDLGLTLMAEAMAHLESKAPLPGKALIRYRCQYRDGLLIALLALRPLRKSTLAQIRIGRELLQVGDRWHLTFDGQQTKNGQPLDFPWPEMLLAALDRYLVQVRSLFPKAEQHDALWASNEARPMTASGITKRVRYWTAKRLGIAISPHRFRDCVASTLANRAPEHVQAAAGLLGHTNLATTERYYIQADNLAANRAYHDVLKSVSQRQATGVKKCR